MIVHLSARAALLPVALTEHEVAVWLWPRMRCAFPDALAAILMPNHPHLVTPTDDVDASWRGLVNLLAGLRRSDNPGARIRWETPDPPGLLSDVGKVRRATRYLALNPCRARLADDPLRWPWSTHRDVVGAVADQWVDAERLGRELGYERGSIADAHHRYVSSDPTVRVAGTPPPEPARPTATAAQPLEAVLAAAASATRADPGDIQRRGPTRTIFVQLAVRHGWNDTEQLANLCRVSPRAVQKLRRRELHSGLGAAELCLGDARLREWRVG